ncbi:aspartate aminotransferase family protein [bacterium]|nr:aspartate aminotransferase family protein [bacterium]
MNAKMKKIHQLTEQYVLKTYGRQSFVATHGKGCYLFGADGKKYLDFVSGIAVNGLGHNHPKITKVITSQAKKILHCSNLYHIPEQALLAEKLCKLTGLSKAFFCNSGAESVESALKLARYWGTHSGNSDKYEVISFSQSFHGRTMGALSATAQKKYQEGFGPLVPGFKVATLNDIESVKAQISANTCAILVEPIQGEGGVNLCTKEFLQSLRSLCDANKILLIFDEVQTGAGRTGYFTASEYFGVKPDIMTIAKALGSGVPIGVCLVNDIVASIAKPGIHASTFGGNALSAAVALETVNIVSAKTFLKDVRKRSDFLMEALRTMAGKYDVIKEVRGAGLMIGVELHSEDGPRIQEYCFSKGILINIIQNKIIRLVPALIVSQKQVEEVLSVLDEAFENLGKAAA